MRIMTNREYYRRLCRAFYNGALVSFAVISVVSILVARRNDGY